MVSWDWSFNIQLFRVYEFTFFIKISQLLGFIGTFVKYLKIPQKYPLFHRLLAPQQFQFLPFNRLYK